MTVLRRLQDLVRGFHAINNQALAGGMQHRHGDAHRNRLPSYNVDGWLNAQFDAAHRIRRP
jgi:hypothetical protein